MHTKGPWKKLQGNSVRVEDADGWLVVYCDISNRTGEECIANAHIIAAAPELLEALKEATKVLDDWNGSTEWKSSVLSAAKSAIAKAEGK